MKTIFASLALMFTAACASHAGSNDGDLDINFDDSKADSSGSAHVYVEQDCGDPDGWAAVLHGTGFAPNSRVTIRVRPTDAQPGHWVIGNYLDTDDHGSFVDNGFLEGIGAGEFWYYGYDDADGDNKRDDGGAYARTRIHSPCH